MRFAHNKPLLLAITAALIVSLMMLSAFSTPTPDPMQTDVIFKEDFTDNSNKWNIGSDENSESVIEGGKLKIHIQRPSDDSSFFKFFTPPASAEDVDISVDATFTKGAPENAAYGFNCRYKDKDNRISLVIKPSGTFTIQKMLNGKWTVLTYWSISGLINRKTGETNNIRLVCSKEHVTLYINDSLAADVVDTDKSLAGGSFRLTAGSYGSNKEDKNPVEMSFDNLVVRKPQAWKAPSGVLFLEKFDKANNNWSLVTQKTDWGYSDQITGGQLVMNFDKANAWNYKRMPIQMINVDMSFDVILKKGAVDDASMGALCRSIDNDNYYAFRISFDLDGVGYYFLGKRVNGTSEKLIDWTETSAVKAGIGKTNRIRVVCSGSDLELYANGQSLFKTKDTSLTFGGPALTASRFEEEDTPVSVAFDNLEVKHP